MKIYSQALIIIFLPIVDILYQYKNNFYPLDACVYIVRNRSTMKRKAIFFLYITYLFVYLSHIYKYFRQIDG